MLSTTEHGTWALPSYSGPFQVASTLHEHKISCDIHIPSCPKLTSIKYRTYYPTSSSQGTQTVWADHSQINGFAQFAGYPSLMKLLVPTLSYCLSHIRLPALEDAPNLPGDWPSVVFTHGLGGTSTSYSTLCGSLASYGMVVYVIEHRDHSASSTTMDGEEIEYFSPVDQTNPILRGRVRNMLQYRLMELEALMELIDEEVSIIGHSFGAATIMEFLNTRPRVSRAVLLDTWAIPLYGKYSPSCPILSLTSSEFQRWGENKAKLDLLVTSQVLDCLHLSHSDAGFIFPRLIRGMTRWKGDGVEVMGETITRILEFVNQASEIILHIT